jgi:glycosyltransferase involved in cell wall biosynthesis
MSCGRPVVASFDEGDLKEILENNHCGIFSHAGNVQEFVSAIRILAEHPACCAEMGVNARQYILDNLTKRDGSRKYVDIIKSVVKK